VYDMLEGTKSPNNGKKFSVNESEREQDQDIESKKSMILKEKIKESSQKKL